LTDLDFNSKRGLCFGATTTVLGAAALAPLPHAPFADLAFIDVSNRTPDTLLVRSGATL